MAKTIIQTIGPLYGEVVNGTVFGRPNGSIYVPDTNEISLETTAQYVRVFNADWGVSYNVLCDENGSNVIYHVVAKSQDIASYIQLQISTTDTFESVKTFTNDAGKFNLTDGAVSAIDVLTIVADEKYYVRAQLIAGSGVPVATSAVYEVTGWAE